MKKSEILRGRELFKQIALTGKKLDGNLLRCTYLTNIETEIRFQVGFKVSAKAFNAVQRNRIRRLLREAFSQERDALYEAISHSSVHVGMMVFFKGAKDVAVERISLPDIQKDVRMFCRAIISRLS